jgi:hypothetical protein
MPSNAWTPALTRVERHSAAAEALGFDLVDEPPR